MGIILFLIGSYQIIKRRKFIKNGKEIEAEVLDYQAQMDDTWGYVYAYTPPGEKRIVAQDNVYHQNKQRRRKKIGEKVILIYNPDKPTEFVNKNMLGMQIGFYLMIIAGMAYAIIGILVVE